MKPKVSLIIAILYIIVISIFILDITVDYSIVVAKNPGLGLFYFIVALSYLFYITYKQNKQ